MSGSEYEYEEALNACKRAGKPDILVYRKLAEPFVGLNDKSEVLARLEQKELLDGFFTRWFQTPDGESYTGTYHVFEDEEHFEKLFEGHMRKLVDKHLDDETSKH